MNRIYHGCFAKNADGTNKIILAREKCLCSTSKSFWKFLEDILDLGIKTRNQTKKGQQRVTKETYNQYFGNKKQLHRWIYSSDLDVTNFA